MQRRPVCFWCEEIVEYDPIFCAPCDHEDCRSAVFHGLCLMSWREHREAAIKEFRKWVSHKEAHDGE